MLLELTRLRQMAPPSVPRGELPACLQLSNSHRDTLLHLKASLGFHCVQSACSSAVLPHPFTCGCPQALRGHCC